MCCEPARDRRGRGELCGMRWRWSHALRNNDEGVHVAGAMPDGATMEWWCRGVTYEMCVVCGGTETQRQALCRESQSACRWTCVVDVVCRLSSVVSFTLSRSLRGQAVTRTPDLATWAC